VTFPLTLLESADLLGRYRYVELAAFAVLGERSARCERAALAVYLSAASRAHAWRAELFERQLPVSAGLPGVGECTRSPGPEVDEALALLGSAAEDDLLPMLLDALYPAMLDAYGARLAAAAPASDGGLVRALRRAVADLEAVLADGRALGAPRPGLPVAQRLGRLVASVGGPFGPLRPGDVAGSRPAVDGALAAPPAGPGPRSDP